MSARALNRRNIHERQAIACLRGGDGFEWHHSGYSPDGLDRLVAMARRRGLVIFPPGTRFVSDGEIELLANLAAAQRQAGRAFINVDSQEFAALLHCATLLRDAGTKLPMAVLQSVAFRLPHVHTLQSVKGRAADGVVRARALSLVHARNVASTDDFAKVGVSRQSVSRFCKNGLIQRVRHGWYRAAPRASHNAADARLNA